MEDVSDFDDFDDEYYEEYSNEEDFFEHQLEDRNINVDSESESDKEWQPEASIPLVPAEDVGGPETSHMATHIYEGLDEAVWAAFSDPLVDRVLARLPLAAFARLRSVCKHWNELPSSSGWLCLYADVERRPSSTIMCHHFTNSFSDTGPPLVPARNEFFCHSEQKWFGMPLLDHSQEKYLIWELVDVDWGLVCYVSYECLWLCVSNPLTKAETLIFPPVPGGCFFKSYPWNYKFAKLVVDRQSKTYKIIVLLRSPKPPSTLVYNSATARWTVFPSYPPFHPRYDRAGCFLWKCIVFMPCVHPGVLLAFDVNVGVWRKVKIESTVDSGMKYLVANNVDRFMILRSYSNIDLHTSTSPISVLSLNDQAVSPFLLFKDDKWIEVDVRNRVYLQNVISIARCEANHNDCLIFTNPTKKLVGHLHF